MTISTNEKCRPALWYVNFEDKYLFLPAFEPENGTADYPAIPKFIVENLSSILPSVIVRPQYGGKLQVKWQSTVRDHDIYKVEVYGEKVEIVPLYAYEWDWHRDEDHDYMLIVTDDEARQIWEDEDGRANVVIRRTITTNLILECYLAGASWRTLQVQTAFLIDQHGIKPEIVEAVEPDRVMFKYGNVGNE